GNLSGFVHFPSRAVSSQFHQFFNELVPNKIRDEAHSHSTPDVIDRHFHRELGNLACEGCMNPQFEVLGIGRTPMNSEEFRKKTGKAAAESKDTRNFSEPRWADFEHRLHYMVGDISDPRFYSQLRVRLEE